jgi:hypothetical protein
METLDETLDGNAIAGLLYEVFGTEMTSAAVTCGSCGAAAAVAEGVVYLHLPGAVVRCRSCTALLMVITQVRGVSCVDLMGMADLALSPGRPETG